MRLPIEYGNDSNSLLWRYRLSKERERAMRIEYIVKKAPYMFRLVNKPMECGTEVSWMLLRDSLSKRVDESSNQMAN